MADKNVVDAARAHTNLNTWAAIQAILEGGTLYEERTHSAASKVIEICKREMKKELAIYDRACAKASAR